MTTRRIPADTEPEQRNESLLSLLKREPEQTSLLLKVGLGGPFFIVGADWIASLFLSDLTVLPFMLALILAYAGILTNLIARLVHSADRWQVESAMNARRLIGGRGRPDAPAPSNTAPPTPDTSFHQAYFLLRLTDEVQRARREGHHMAVVVIDATLPGHKETPELVERVSLELAHIASNQSKVISHTLSLGGTEFVFSLPNSDAASVKAFVSKLVQGLGNYWCHFGVAVYPSDATSAEGLVEKARNQCERSRKDRTPDREETFAAQRAS